MAPVSKSGRTGFGAEQGTEQGRAVLAGRIPAAPVPGGEGKVGEEIEEVELYPLVGLDGVGAAGRGTTTRNRGRRRWGMATAALR